MYISYQWLRELTGTTMKPDELRDQLTMVGLAVDSVETKDDDYILDVEVPSNRPDCLSHLGIAREVAVIYSVELSQPSARVTNAVASMQPRTAVEIRDLDLCPRYAARLVTGVTIAPSPSWLAHRLESIGQRPINNVADITNYVLHEMGQPLHAFDFAKLAGGRIIVRRAKDGEALVTLDGTKRELTSNMLVIADTETPVALAGIMGGLDSEISSKTVDVLIESAYFNPNSVRRTARTLGMETEASRRFERGADRGAVLRAQARCIDLICEIAGGTASQDAIDVNPNPLAPRNVDLHPGRVEELTSVRVEDREITRILSGLGFTETESKEATARTFIPPSWRADIEREEDLVEEVTRHVGYDKIATALPPSTRAGEYQPREKQRRALRQALTAQGFIEAINFSFIDSGHDGDFTLIPEFDGQNPENLVTLKNPIIENAVRMRPTLVPGLLNSLRRNLNHGVRDVRLFEVGRIFMSAATGGLPIEREALALIATGGAVEEGTAQSIKELDFFDLKGALQTGLEAFALEPLYFDKTAAKHLQLGQAARIVLASGVTLGWMGRLADSLADAYKFRQPVFVAEVDFSLLMAAEGRLVQYSPLPRYPSVVRDVTLLVDRNITLASLLQAIAEEGVEDYRGTSLVGTYEGSNIEPGKRAITLRVEYRSENRTLRDEEVEQRHRTLVDRVLQQFGATQH